MPTNQVSNQQQSLIDKELDELYKICDRGETKGLHFTLIRKILAYTLKFVAAGGSLAIATALLKKYDQIIGIAVLVVIFIDELTSNHKRLIAEVEAGYAYRSLRSRAKWSFNSQFELIIDDVKAEDQAAIEQYKLLKKEAHDMLTTGIESIRQKLQDADIAALKSLSLDAERKNI